MIQEDPRSIQIPVLRIKQPIGEIYVGSISAKKLYEIAHFDVRRIESENGFDQYLGIQRELNKQRVKAIRTYTLGQDASFPTSVVLAIDERCVKLEQPCTAAPEFFRMTLSNYGEDEGGNAVQVSLYRSIARVIDGQHRIAGLEGYSGAEFDLNVSLFVGADLADQAAVFSAVNLTQTKVNRSLAYDLFSISESPSPERTAHLVAVALDQLEKSPFKGRIMRLGKATPGRTNETLSQAVVVNAILDYISGTANQVLLDRQAGRRSKDWPVPEGPFPERLILRPFFVDGRDTDIAKLLLAYFDAVQERWEQAWRNVEPGYMLNRTNGFMGLMRFLRPAYLKFARPGRLVEQSDFLRLFRTVNLEREDFTTENFIPGSAGASRLYQTLCEQTGLEP